MKRTRLRTRLRAVSAAPVALLPDQSNPTFWANYSYSGAYAISSDLRTVTRTNVNPGQTSVARCGEDRNAGKMYIELVVNTAKPSGYVRFGLLPASTAHNGANIGGAATIGVGFPTNIGSGSQTWVQSETTYTTDGATGSVPIVDGSVIGIAIDFGLHKVWFTHNGVGNGSAATGTGGASYTKVDSYFPAVCANGTDGLGFSVTLRRIANYQYLPAGFVPWMEGREAAYSLPTIAPNEQPYSLLQTLNEFIDGPVLVSGTVPNSFDMVGDGALHRWSANPYTKTAPIYSVKATAPTPNENANQPFVDAYTQIPISYTGANEEVSPTVRQRGQAISPWHIYGAAHAFPPVGSTLYWRDYNGTVVSRTVVAALTMVAQGGFSGQYDVRVGLLNAALPSEVGFMKVLPENPLPYLVDPAIAAPDGYPGNVRLPAWHLNQFDEWRVVPIMLSRSPSELAAGADMTYGSNPAWAGVMRPVVSGDSGSPVVLQDVNSWEPVLLGTWSTATRFAALVGIHQRRVNDLMAALHGSRTYQLTPADTTDLKAWAL